MVIALAEVNLLTIIQTLVKIDANTVMINCYALRRLASTDRRNVHSTLACVQKNTVKLLLGTM